MIRRYTRRLPAGLLGGWAVLMTLVGAQLMRPHWVPLPRPEAGDAAWADRVRAAAPGAGPGQWTALHVLKAGCGCSQRALRHLAGRSPEPNVCERVLWVSEGPAAPDPDPRPAGYEVEVLTGGELATRYGVAAAPMLVILAPDGTPRYAGGYTARKQGPELRDRDILTRTMAGHSVPPLPVFGCPVGD